MSNERVGKVSDILIYPIVSCGPIQVSSALCSPDGLIAINIQDKGMVLCIKNKYPHPMLAYGEYRQIPFRDACKITTEISQDSIILTDSKGSIVRFKPTLTNKLKGKSIQFVCVKSIYRGFMLKESNAEVGYVGQVGNHKKVEKTKLNNWFKTLLNPPDELQVLHRERLLLENPEGRNALGVVTVMNGASILKLTEGNPGTTIKKATSCYRLFCPNIVISGSRAFSENMWKRVKFGSYLVAEIESPDIRIVEDEHSREYSNSQVNVGQPAESVEEFSNSQFMCALDESKTLGLQMRFKQSGEITVGDPIYAQLKHPETFEEIIKYFAKMWRERQRTKTRSTIRFPRPTNLLEASRKSLSMLTRKIRGQSKS